MTLLLTGDDVQSVTTTDSALEAVREGFRLEAAGRSQLPMRVDTDTPTGFLRVMPAVLDGVMGCKVMTLVRGSGTRYLVLLYDVETGGCLAVIDADTLTKTRTAATTALGGLHLCPDPPRDIAVIGTGFEAQGHLAFLSDIWPLETVWVYSRSPENREQFVANMADQIGVDIRPAQTAEEAVAASDTTLLATKASTPVIDGEAFGPGAVVLSIGSTRPDLRELDRRTLERTSTLVVDARQQVCEDSGDIMEALATAAITTDRIVELAQLVSEERVLDRAPVEAERNLQVFKSAGTALQDLALARHVYEQACADGRGQRLDDISRLKPFS